MNAWNLRFCLYIIFCICVTCNVIILFPHVKMRSRWQWSIALPTDDEGSTLSSSSRGKKGMYLRRYNTPRANPRLKPCLGPIDPSPYSKRRDSEARTQKFEWDKVLPPNKVLREKINNKNLMKKKRPRRFRSNLYVANLYSSSVTKINKEKHLKILDASTRRCKILLRAARKANCLSTISL